MKNGCYKLSWRERIGFSAGDLAQNLIYQTVSIWLLFFYTNVYGLKPSVSAVMFLVVRIIDVIWDPIVGAFIDKANPRWGKYRSWLLFAGIPLAAFAMLCFWNGFSGSLLYAYITYVGMSMCFTLINVPYGALNSSLTRDTDEITILTSVRMFFANLAGLIIKTLPLVIAIFAPKVMNPETGRMEAVYNTPESAHAWFITMSIFALTGLALLIFCFFESKERIVMAMEDTEKVKVSDLWMELVRNRPVPQGMFSSALCSPVPEKRRSACRDRIHVGSCARGGYIWRIYYRTSCGSDSERPHMHIHEGRNGPWWRYSGTRACVGRI